MSIFDPKKHKVSFTKKKIVDDLFKDMKLLIINWVVKELFKKTKRIVIFNIF